MGAQAAIEERVSAVEPRPRAAPPRVPPLENGDQLTREEFERRYWTMPDVKKAELIEGVVHMPTPVGHSHHGRPHSSIAGWLTVYRAATPGVDCGDNSSIRVDADNELQPDAFLRLEPAAGGKSRISEDDFVEGPPELVVEVAATSTSRDLHGKMRVYRRNGVREYIVWRVLDSELDWFALGPGDTVKLTAGESGVVCSQVFPGLCLAVEALLKGDMATVLAELQRSLQSPEHAAFVQRLQGQTQA